MAEPLQLIITLDRPDATHALGDTIAGTLEVRALDDVTVRGIKVGPRYRVISRGLDAGGGPGMQDLMPEGADLRAGETRSLRFEAQLPFQPPPYDGKNFEVDWVVEARADVPWGRDPRSEPVPLDVEVGPAARDASYEHWVGPVQYDLEQEEKGMRLIRRLKEGSCVLKLLAGCFIPMFLSGLLMFGLSLVSIAGGHPSWDTVRYGGILMLPFLVLWWASGRFFSPEKTMGTVDIDVEPQEARPGDTVRCRVVFHPRRSVAIEPPTLTLRARERYEVRTRSGTDTSDRTVWDTLHEDVRELTGPRELTRGEPVRWEESFRLAEGVPYSLEANRAGLRWSFEVKIPIRLSRDLIREAPLVVRP